MSYFHIFENEGLITGNFVLGIFEVSRIKVEINKIDISKIRTIYFIPFYDIYIPSKFKLEDN